MTGNDGSLHLFEQEAAAAWLITRNEDEYVSAVFLLREASITSLSSYRSELEGIFRCLKSIEDLGMTPKEVQHWCDNERAVIGSVNDINSPKSMLGADADILLAIQHIRRSISYTAYQTCLWSSRY